MRIIFHTLLLTCLLGSAFVLNAQENDPNALKTGPDAVPKLPADACFYATLHVKEIVSMPELKLMPWEVISAAGIDNLGFDPLVIDRLDLILGFKEDAERPVRYAIVARTSTPIQITDIKPTAIEPLKQFNPSIVQLNDRYVLAGDLDYIKRVVNEPAADGELKRQIARIGDSALAWCALVLSPIQKQVDELVATAAPDSRADFETILKKTKLLAARVDVQNQSIPVILETGSEADAIAVEEVIKKFNQRIVEEQNARAENDASQLPQRVGDAVLQFKDRFLKEYQRVSVVTRKGARLSAKLDQDYYEISQMGTNITVISTIIKALQEAGL